MHEDPEIVSHWCSLVGGSVPTRGRPRRLLVFINPHGGRGQAPALFYNTILPLFSLAGIETKVGGFYPKRNRLHTFTLRFFYYPPLYASKTKRWLYFCQIFSYFPFLLWFYGRIRFVCALFHALKCVLEVGLADPDSGHLDPAGGSLFKT